MARLRRLWLTDFRGYRELDVTFSEGVTAILGDNGQGKTNLVEAIAWLATLSSFRGAPTEALIRRGADRAIVRAEIDSDGREVLIEAEIPRTGRTRVQVNRQRLTRGRELMGVVRATVFAPDDLRLIKEGPGERRRFLDELLAARHPKFDEQRAAVDKVLRQRNTLLKQAGGRLTEEVAITLDVWDTKLVTSGTALADRRVETLSLLEPHLATAYDQLAGQPAQVSMHYDAPWRGGGLAEALATSRRDDLRRGVTTVGPHRDDVVLAIGGLAARTHASQGEQRSLALALRLAAQRLATEETGQAPILILDDVFSELDPDRSDALLAQLPDSQALLTSAAGLPPRARPDCTWSIVDHHLTEVPDD
ncbi:MAG: DNA replication/repair protein RecF [Acidimicrobiia bacterium]|nr:DNA replication/repair protein RecF [Acidimicrobiia bacterium]MDH5236563.1 DNA replication/repair protein RecF [Acidimicrobiia bacterium]